MTIIGIAVAAALCAADTPPAPPPAAVLEIVSQTGGPPVRVPVAAPGAAQAACDAFGVRFTLDRYEPSIRIRERFEAAEAGAEGVPVLRVELRAQGRTIERYLVPGSRTWGRAMLREAIIECLSERTGDALDALAREIAAMYDERPKIVMEIKRDGSRRLIPAEAGATHTVRDPPYTVEVLRVVKCFAIDPATKKVEDRSELPLNPAARVRIAHGGETRETWLFSQLPEFSQQAEDDDAVFRFVWPAKGHPHPRGEIVIVDAAGGDLPVFVRTSGELQRVALAPGRSLTVTGLRLTLIERVPRARLVQEILVHPGQEPALRVSWGTRSSRWVPLGGAEEIRTDGKVLMLRLRPPDERPHEGMAAPASSAGTLPPGHPPIGPDTPPQPR